MYLLIRSRSRVCIHTEESILSVLDQRAWGPGVCARVVLNSSSTNFLTVVMRRTPSVLIPICRHRGLHARVSGSSSCIFEHLGLPADTPRSEVRRRYLEAALRTHPDHCLDADAATRMAVLQTAWESYRRSDARRRRTASQTGGAPAEGFATFGVGCSFADSEQESAERAEIITMASRGMMNPRPLTESKCVTADTAAARHV